MNTALLHSEIQNFIFNFEGDTSKLAFAGSPFPAVTVSELLQQIESRNAIAKKLPTWHVNKNIIYPPKINLEQTSSEATAKYKAALVQGERLADLTGGFGVDSFYFSKYFNSVTHFEINGALSEIATHNFKVLGRTNVNTVHGNGIEALEKERFDVIYVDPSRRNKAKGKVFFLKDCEPNIPLHLKSLFTHCDTLMVKTSPMLDLAVGMDELQNVSEIHIVAVANEVKEVLWVLRETNESIVKIHTVNFTKSELQEFSFNNQQQDKTTYSTPKKYLYEPNAALLKSGGFKFLSEAFGIQKLHQHSHLFTSSEIIPFPGRRFVIEKIVPYTKRDMRNGITFDTANITTRNFPEPVAILRKKWKLKDGGDRYLFFTTLENDDKIMLICSKY